MRVYKFLEAQYAIDAIENESLKLSEINELNDPYEIDHFSFSNLEDKEAFRAFKNCMNEKHLISSFSKSFSSPVAWGHYAEKHKGICLGFEVKKIDSFKQMAYLESPLPFERGRFETMSSKQRYSLMQDLLFKKYVGWSYEDEVRGFFQKKEKDTESQLFFSSFSDMGLILKEVIIGFKCKVNHVKECRKACFGRDVYIFEAVLAEDSFKIKKWRDSR